MVDISNIKKQIVVQEQNKVSIKQIIEAQVNELKKCLPSDITPERMCRIALNNYRQNPKLADCTPESFIAALFMSAQLGLEPGVGGQAYLIPYNQSKKINGQWVSVMNVNFQIGYQGLVKLFYRNVNASILEMQKVCENDKFDYQLGTDGYIKHTPALKDRGEVIAYYAIAKMKDGNSSFKIMSKEECIEHGKKHSKSFADGSSPWQTEPDAMCMKTVLIQLLKTMPKSITIQEALSMDNTTKLSVSENMLDVKDVTEWSDNNAD